MIKNKMLGILRFWMVKNMAQFYCVLVSAKQPLPGCPLSTRVCACRCGGRLVQAVFRLAWDEENSGGEDQAGADVFPYV